MSWARTCSAFTCGPSRSRSAERQTQQTNRSGFVPSRSRWCQCVELLVVAVHPPARPSSSPPPPHTGRSTPFVEEMPSTTARPRLWACPAGPSPARTWKLPTGGWWAWAISPRTATARLQGVTGATCWSSSTRRPVCQRLWTGVEAITTTANSRILAIGNPDDRETTFGDVYEEERYGDLGTGSESPHRPHLTHGSMFHPST